MGSCSLPWMELLGSDALRSQLAAAPHPGFPRTSHTNGWSHDSPSAVMGVGREAFVIKWLEFYTVSPRAAALQPLTLRITFSQVSNVAGAGGPGSLLASL